MRILNFGATDAHISTIYIHIKNCHPQTENIWTVWRSVNYFFAIHIDDMCVTKRVKSPVNPFYNWAPGTLVLLALVWPFSELFIYYDECWYTYIVRGCRLDFDIQFRFKWLTCLTVTYDYSIRNMNFDLNGAELKNYVGVLNSFERLLRRKL